MPLLSRIKSGVDVTVAAIGEVQHWRRGLRHGLAVYTNHGSVWVWRNGGLPVHYERRR